MCVEVRRINIDDEIVLVFHRDKPSFIIKLINAKTVLAGEGLPP